MYTWERCTQDRLTHLYLDAADIPQVSWSCSTPHAERAPIEVWIFIFWGQGIQIPRYNQALPKVFHQIHPLSAQHYTPTSAYWFHLRMKRECGIEKDLDKWWALSRVFEPASIPTLIIRSRNNLVLNILPSPCPLFIFWKGEYKYAALYMQEKNSLMS